MNLSYFAGHDSICEPQRVDKCLDFMALSESEISETEGFNDKEERLSAR